MPWLITFVIFCISAFISWLIGFEPQENKLMSVLSFISNWTSLICFALLTYWYPQLEFNDEKYHAKFGEKETLKHKIFKFLAGFYWLVWLIIFVLLLAIFI